MNSMKRRVQPVPRKCSYQVQETVVIHSSLDHDIDLRRRKSGLNCSGNATQNRRNSCGGAVHGFKYRIVEAVEADSHPLETGLLKRHCMTFKQHSIRSHRDIINT
jgi:hypothetical protein